MAEKTKYYEIYGELVRNNVFLQRLVFALVAVNVIIAILAYISFTRPAQTYVVKDGYAYSTDRYESKRSVPEVRRFCQEFVVNLLEFNRENFNTHIKNALQMCSDELEYVMYSTIKESNIPKIVQNTTGTIKFNVDEIFVKEGDPFRVRITGQQVFPGQPPIGVRLDLALNIVSRTENNPFGLRIVDFNQGKT